MSIEELDDEEKAARYQATIASLSEEAEDREVARDYRRLNATDFYQKYFQGHSDSECIEICDRIDFGLESNAWID